MIKLPEFLRLHEQQSHYCGYALELMRSGTDQAIETLSKHIPTCGTCLKAQAAEERAMKLDGEAQRKREGQ